MSCNNPYTAWVPVDGTNKLKFKHNPDTCGAEIEIECGKCMACRLERSRQWAMRCVHEAQTHDESSFITLTYNEENIPSDGSLDHTHFQEFMKKLRARLGKKKYASSCVANMAKNVLSAVKTAKNALVKPLLKH